MSFDPARTRLVSDDRTIAIAVERASGHGFSRATQAGKGSGFSR